MQWFAPAYTRFECCRYTANRIATIKLVKDANAFWFRGYRLSKPDQVAFIDAVFGPSYAIYVSGFTFRWDKLIEECGAVPSAYDEKDRYLTWFGQRYKPWYKSTLVPALDKHIAKKDIVFEIDRVDGQPLCVAGGYALRIIDYLESKGLNWHCIFSGRGGYHVVVDDCERFAKDYGVAMLGRSAKALSYIAIETTKKMLDEIFPTLEYQDFGSVGRDYPLAHIHFSPMLPNGLRKAAYSITEHGTVCLPVCKKEIMEAKDIDYYRAENVIKNFRINGRGIPSTLK